jgi:hypothetical protein
VGGGVTESDKTALRAVLNAGSRDEQGRFRSRDWQFDRIVELADDIALRAVNDCISASFGLRLRRWIGR